mmetsp:Transcript_21968/g.63067  ORF Transcript_21968/g.63067 Transcript_21968/m.63067 type:complete len:289 (-) Transcript_21968:109-975(-)
MPFAAPAGMAGRVEGNPNMALPVAAPVDRQGMMQKLKAVLARFEITIAEANELSVLEDYEMVIIADDSGSMQMSSLPPQMRQLGQPGPTRWEELKHTVSEIVEIATCFDTSGVDVFFLNRQPVMGVNSATDPRFLMAFAPPPQGTTPLTETLQRVAARMAGEKPILLFILTDGVPNGGPEPFKRALKRLLAPGAACKMRVQVMACTGDDNEIGWLNVLDRELAELDVTDDYHTEAAEVVRAGLAKRFTRGDWCMKAMLGPVVSKFDAWDEALGRSKHSSAECNLCCVQ